MRYINLFDSINTHVLRSLQNADHADCRLQTVQTMQTEYFFLTLDSLSSVLQLQNSVKYVIMFFIYPKTTQTSTSDCWFNRQTRLIDLKGNFLLLILTVLKSSIKFNFHGSRAHIASIFDGFMVLPLFSLIRDFEKQNTRGNVSKNFRQSCVLSTDQIEIHQSQPASMTQRRSEARTSGCDWWISIRYYRWRSLMSWDDLF